MHLTPRIFSHFLFSFSNHFFPLLFLLFFLIFSLPLPGSFLQFFFYFLPYHLAFSYILFFFFFHFSLFLSYSSSIYFSSFPFYLHVLFSQSSCSSASYCLPLGRCEISVFSLPQLYNLGPQSSGTWRCVTWQLVSDILRQIIPSSRFETFKNT